MCFLYCFKNLKSHTLILTFMNEVILNISFFFFCIFSLSYFASNRNRGDMCLNFSACNSLIISQASHCCVNALIGLRDMCLFSCRQFHFCCENNSFFRPLSCSHGVTCKVFNRLYEVNFKKARLTYRDAAHISKEEGHVYRKDM